VKLRPLRNWLLVKLEPIPSETAGGLVLPQGTSGQERVRFGTVLRTGPGVPFWSDVLEKELLQPVDVVPGERIAFFRENLEHKQGRGLLQVLQELEDDVGLIRENDILYAVSGAGT